MEQQVKKFIFNGTLIFWILILVSCAGASAKNEEYVRPKLIPSTCPPFGYPKAAMQDNVQGITFLELHINTKGDVIETKVKKSSGSEILDAATIKYLGSCKYKPATQGGKPIDTWFDMKYNWKIEDSPSEK